MPLSWTRQPLRFLQHLLRETDAKGITAKTLVAEMKRVGANACIAMGGGFSAWYPTQLDCQTRNPHLTSDFLGDFLAKAKAENFRVLIRMDISKGRECTELRNRDWFVQDVEGAISYVWGMPQMCATGDFWQREAFSILGEIMENYPSGDGFFFNYLHVPRCHCRRCQDIVSQATGRAVPAAGVRDPPYEEWRQGYLADYMMRVRDFLHARNPAAALVPYHHVRDGWDIRRMAAISDIIGSQISNPVMPNPIDPQPIWNLWAAEEARLARSLKPDASPLLIQTTSAVFASRQSAMPNARLVGNLMQAAAHGASTAPAVNGLLEQDDARFVPALVKLGCHLVRNGQWYQGQESIARVAVLRCDATRLWGPNAGTMAGAALDIGHVSEFRGICEMLSDMRYPYDLVAAPGFSLEELARYDVLVLPALSCLGDADAKIIDAFVTAGGSIIATADFGAADLQGARRAAAATRSLPALPGASRSAVGAYFALADGDLRATLDGVPCIAAAGDFWSPAGMDVVESDLRIIGPFVNNAPEFTSIEGDGEEPGLLTVRTGGGTAIWLPWRIGALYHRHAMSDYRLIFGQLICRTIGKPPVRTNAPSAVNIVLYRHPDGLILHFLNQAANQTKALVELAPLAGFNVWVETAADTAIHLNKNEKLPTTRDGPTLSFRLERLDHFAAIALRCSAGGADMSTHTRTLNQHGPDRPFQRKEGNI